VKCLAFFGGVFGFFMFWQSGNPDSASLEPLLEQVTSPATAGL